VTDPTGEGAARPRAARSFLPARLTRQDWTVLGWWTLAHAMAFGLVAILDAEDIGGVVPATFLTRWYHWDAIWFTKVAEHGYRYAGYPTGQAKGVAAFFPGLPLAIRGVHAVIGPVAGTSPGGWVLSGLIVTFVLGGVAMVLLGRLAVLESGKPAMGSRAARLAMFSFMGVFLIASYSEAPFLAFALGAWLAAKCDRWWLAGVLAATAGLFRIDGVFLALALAVMWACSGRPRRALPGLALSVVGVAAYVVYLHHLDGTWLEYLDAQKGWDRHFTQPVTSLVNTIHRAREKFPVSHFRQAVYRENFDVQQIDYRVVHWVDIASMALGVGLTVLLAVKRKLPEAVWVGLQVTLLATSVYYLSVSRATLMWWPLWILLARWGERRWVRWGLLTLGGLALLAGVGAFSADQWVN
jgi:hypothetical protein